MTREQLKEIGLADDQIKKVMDLHGTDIEEKKTEIKNLQSDISAKDTTIKDLNKQIKDAEGNAQSIKDLQDKVTAYEKAEADRKAAEQAAKEDEILTKTILDVIGDKQFVNDITKEGIISQVKAGLADEANKGKGARDIFEALTKDKEGIFANPQQQRLNIPPAGGASGEGTKIEFKPFF